MKISIERKSGLLIPKAVVGDIICKRIKNHLTRIIKDYTGTNNITLKFYIENSDFLKVPRYFPIQHYIPDCNIIESSKEGKDIDINHKITLRDDVQKNTTKYMLQFTNGIVQALPGSGKTVMGVYVAAERKKKTIVLVHRDALVDQWIGPGTPGKPQGFKAFTDVKDDDIIRLTSSNYKEALQKSVIVTTDQTFVSILKKDRVTFLKELFEANIGMFIADEVHTSVGAPTFAECSISIPSRMVYGLSATPYRNDGNSDIINYHLGPIYVPEGVATTMIPKVTVVLMGYGIVTSKTRRYVYWNGKLNRSRYLNMLYKSNILMDFSKFLVEKLASEDRQIIYTCDRIDYIDKLYNMMNVSSKSKFVKSAKSEVLKEQVTIATTSKIRDGVDCVDKDCAIMISPISNVEQMAGRICRHKEGKRQPSLIDIVDIDEPQIVVSFIKRFNFYKKKGWEVQFLYNDGIKTLKLTEESAKSIYGRELV